MSTDVNEAFAAERAGQLQAAADRQANIDSRVSEGKLVALGGNRFRINEPGNWDNGEVLYLAEGQLLPQHGLDTTATGDIALYSAVPAWHGLGQIIPDGTSDIDKVLQLSGLDFTVELVPALYAWKGETREHADRYHTVRDDTGESLGIVGKNYEVVQNRQSFEFLQDLVNNFGVVWESAGSLRQGRKVFVSMRLPENVTVDAEGINDEIIPFIAAINTHDGCSAFETLVTPWRPVCANTERFAVRDAVTRWKIRHTNSATKRFEEARRTLHLTINYFEQFAAEETALARTDLAVDEFNALLADLWPVDNDATDRVKKNADERRDTLNGLFGREAERSGRTAYAGERAVTEYLDHYASLRPSAAMKENVLGARGQRLLEGTDDDTKSKAHKRLMLVRTNR